MTQAAVPTDGHAHGRSCTSFASKDPPGRQHEILDAVAKILTCVEPSPAAG